MCSKSWRWSRFVTFFCMLLFARFHVFDSLKLIFWIHWQEDNDDDDFEDVVDNDAGEDLLLKKLAEQSEAAAQQQQSVQDTADEPEDEGSSSREFPKHCL